MTEEIPDDKPLPKYLTDEFWDRHPFTVIRKKMSPKNLENNFVQFVMNRAEYIRKRKGIRHHDILPFDERFYRLLRSNRRAIYCSTLFLLAQGLGVSIDDLVEGYECPPIKDKVIKDKVIKDKGKPPVSLNVYDVNGILEKSYTSLMKATKDGFNDSSIRKCLKNIYKQHKGYRYEKISNTTINAYKLL